MAWRCTCRGQPSGPLPEQYSACESIREERYALGSRRCWHACPSMRGTTATEEDKAGWGNAPQVHGCRLRWSNSTQTAKAPRGIVQR